jgi:hypothetical protein
MAESEAVAVWSAGGGGGPSDASAARSGSFGASCMASAGLSWPSSGKFRCECTSSGMYLRTKASTARAACFSCARRYRHGLTVASAAGSGAHGNDRDITIKLRSCYARVLWNQDVDDDYDLFSYKDEIAEAITILEDTARFMRRTFGAQHTHTKATQSELEAAREKLALLEIFLSGDEELIESMTEAARARRPGGHQAADEAKEPAPAPAPPPRRRKPRSLTQIADFLCDGPGL